MRIEDINSEILGGLSGQAKEDFERGLAALNMANPADRDALRKSIERLQPEFTPEQIEAFMAGRDSPPG